MKAWTWMWVVCAAIGFSGCGNGNATNNDGGTDGGPTVVCGDGMMEGEEQCDDGNTTDGDGCDSECFIEGMCGDDVVEGREQCEGGENCFPPGHADECEFIPTSFRWNKFELTDPSFYALLFGDVCAAANGVLNGILTATVNNDSPPAAVTLPPKDGLVDLGFQINLFPLAQNDGDSYEGTFQAVTCNAGEKPLNCGVQAGASVLEFAAMSSTTDDCLGIVPDSTTSDPAPQPVTAGSAACFVGGPESVTIQLGSTIAIPLTDVRLAAEFDADPAQNMMNGLIVGFLSEEAGQAAVIDAELGPPFGGFSLAQLLMPDTLQEGGACDGAGFAPPPVADQDTLEDGTVGWWFYLKFEAEPTVWNGGALCGNGVVNEGESCDRGIPSGMEGACDLDCDDGIACTIDTLNDGDPCNPTCWHHGVGSDSDACCPLVAEELASQDGNLIADLDCINLCDDGTLQNFEQCDDSEGTACDDVAVLCADDGDACTVEQDVLVPIGQAQTVRNLCVQCPAGDDACECKRTTINQTDTGADGCCPNRCINNPSGPGCAADTNCQ